MIQFSSLRINGFKSFVEKTELDIGPGLTGIVGPNGCGKSNLLEALRWVMGENSAKRMRGGEMEDVIFNGTDKRTPRNIAEVSLLLDNSTRSAPAAYNSSDEVEILRRIERDHGSNYKINGKNVRARDVQMLFADTVTGANSPAMVSQGRVSQIINAKPLDRRLILEESAGISGLFARRHEAELRLRAADANLVRIEDVLAGMESRLNELKKQSRQATRYRNVNTQIRQMEVLVAWLEWQTLEQRIATSQAVFDGSESEVVQKLTAVTQLTRTQTTQSEDLPTLRQKEVEAAAALQNLRIALQRLEDEAQRHSSALGETAAQIEQTANDKSHEAQVLEESAQVLERLEAEHAAIVEQEGNDKGKLEEKQSVRDKLEEKVVALEEQFTALMQSAAETRALRQSLEQQIEQNKERIQTALTRRQKSQDDLSAFESSKDSESDAIELLNKINELEDNSKKLNEKYESKRRDTTTSRDALETARSALSRAESEFSEFRSETAMLESLLRDDSGKFRPVRDQLTAESGFEKAISRALGDALLASLESEAPTRWLGRNNAQALPFLPHGITPLLPSVQAPAELHAALSQIGLVRDEAEGHAQRGSLLPGQALVSRDGFYWRWDGYFVGAQASDRNAVHLEQKNRLADLQRKKPAIEQTVQERTAILREAEANLAALESSNREIEATLKAAEEELAALRARHASAREDQVRRESEITRLKDTIKILSEDIQTLEEVSGWDAERLKAYDKAVTDKKEEDTEAVRRTLAEIREAHQAAVRAFDLIQQQQNSRQARMHAISDERINTQNRLIRSRERLKQLEERQAVLAQKLEELKRQPDTFREDREEILSKVSAQETVRAEAAESLSVRENEVSETTKALKIAEGELSECRETRAGAQATLSALKEQRDGLSATIQEQFNASPAELPQHAAIDVEENPDNLETLRAKKEKLLRERDNIGPVNLRADEETQTLQKDVDVLMNERNDLMQAIAELRGGINKINVEARERLLGAFEHVNNHFQTLFTRLFGGGKAHLALIDSEDPLGAGLEIFAQPPGKALQSLSLLSGGEQALASIALIFAMFLTNPSPICVLDEIDAPLDDANVDRVCNLLEDIAARGETRFLIITHHRMTMARMHRLYGVTMAEKGISQLVSVDLQQSFEFLEAA